MLSLDLTNHAKDFLGTLDPGRFHGLVKKIFTLMETPNLNGSRMVQGHQFWSADLGEYRIIYRVDGNCLKVALLDRLNIDENNKRISHK